MRFLRLGCGLDVGWDMLLLVVVRCRQDRLLQSDVTVLCDREGKTSHILDAFTARSTEFGKGDDICTLPESPSVAKE